MIIQVNGKSQTVGDQTTVAELLVKLDVAVKHVAVERNRELVPRAQHHETTLAENDELEVVTLVGGG